MALRRVYRDNRRPVVAYVKQNSGSESEAKDVLQDAVIAFYENVIGGKFRGESAISSYLFSIARFIWLNQLKRKQRHLEKLEVLAINEAEPSLPLRLIEKESEEHLVALFGQLGTDCQQVLMASIYEGMDMKQIAVLMGFENDQVARNKKYRCLKKLKLILKDNPGILSMLNR